MKVLLTCPPMIGMVDKLTPLFEQYEIELTIPKIIQTVSEEELEELVPLHEGWIIGDDPATRKVFAAGKRGLLRAAVKWGIGVDNVDFLACKELNIPIENTPNMFGAEVADLALGYVNALARNTYEIDRAVRALEWPKPSGISMAEKTVALIGFGDIGKNTAKRLIAADMQVIAYDPNFNNPSNLSIQAAVWPDRLGEADFIVITCALTKTSLRMLNADSLAKCKKGVRVINVGRGPIVDEKALINALESGVVYSAALDVFEEEPLPEHSRLRSYPRCIFGSHNASNTEDAVKRASEVAVTKLIELANVL